MNGQPYTSGNYYPVSLGNFEADFAAAYDKHTAKYGHPSAVHLNPLDLPAQHAQSGYLFASTPKDDRVVLIMRQVDSTALRGRLWLGHTLESTGGIMIDTTKPLITKTPAIDDVTRAAMQRYARRKSTG